MLVAQKCRSKMPKSDSSRAPQPFVQEADAPILLIVKSNNLERLLGCLE